MTFLQVANSLAKSHEWRIRMSCEDLYWNTTIWYATKFIS